MSKHRPKRDIRPIEEATISNMMWEIAAILELLERKGLCTQQDLHTIIDELRRKNPLARIPETAISDPNLLTETEAKIMDDILGLLDQSGLTLQQSHNLLKQLGRMVGRIIIEKEKREGKGTTH